MAKFTGPFSASPTPPTSRLLAAVYRHPFIETISEHETVARAEAVMECPLLVRRLDARVDDRVGLAPVFRNKSPRRELDVIRRVGADDGKALRRRGVVAWLPVCGDELGAEAPLDETWL